MATHVEEAMAATPLYRNLSPEDRKRLAAVAVVKSYEKGDHVFSEGDPSEYLYTIVSGRVKAVKLLPGGREVILEISTATGPSRATLRRP